MSKLEAKKGTVLDELRERREQLEQLTSARDAWRREVERARRWDRAWMKWGRGVAILVVLGVLAFELARELIP